MNKRIKKKWRQHNKIRDSHRVRKIIDRHLEKPIIEPSPETWAPSGLVIAGIEIPLIPLEVLIDSRKRGLALVRAIKDT